MSPPAVRTSAPEVFRRPPTVRPDPCIPRAHALLKARGIAWKPAKVSQTVRKLISREGISTVTEFEQRFIVALAAMDQHEAESAAQQPGVRYLRPRRTGHTDPTRVEAMRRMECKRADHSRCTHV